MEINEKPAGRSFLLWVLALLLLLSAMDGFQRLGVALSSWDTLVSLGMQPGPLYAVLSGLVWGLVSLGAGLGLLLGQAWAPTFTRAGVVFLAAFYWIDHLALTRAAVAEVNQPFAAIITAVLLAYTFGVLALPAQRRWFGKK